MQAWKYWDKTNHFQADQGIGWGAIYYMHENQVCHRDLKPENFLFMTKDLGEPHTALMQTFLSPFRTDAVDPLAAQASQVEHIETFVAVLVKPLHSLPPSFLHPHRPCCKILSPEPCHPSWVPLPRSESCQTWNTSKRNPSRWQQRPPVLMTSVFGMGSLVPRWKWPTSALSQCPCISSLNFRVTTHPVHRRSASPSSLSTVEVLPTSCAREGWLARRWFA